jgi:hypothetical protein
MLARHQDIVAREELQHAAPALRGGDAAVTTWCDTGVYCCVRQVEANRRIASL